MAVPTSLLLPLLLPLLIPLASAFPSSSVSSITSANFSSSSSFSAPLAATRNGTYAGIHLPVYSQDIFLGIPYAASTEGSNRFRPPRALDTTWDGVRAAFSYGPRVQMPAGRTMEALEVGLALWARTA